MQETDNGNKMHSNACSDHCWCCFLLRTPASYIKTYINVTDVLQVPSQMCGAINPGMQLTAIEILCHSAVF